MRAKNAIAFAVLMIALASFALNSASGQSNPASSHAASKGSGASSKDEEAIRKSAREYSQAFEKGDAKAIAAMWVDRGEYEDDSGKLLHGRDEIEKAYAELFKEKRGGKVDVKIQSIRFLTPDVAVEEGILRETGAGRELPSTTRYSAIDVRDGGQWKIALCREWGAGQDHLDDLNWLTGNWKGTSKDGDLTVSFAWDEKQPILLAKLAKKPSAKNAAAQSSTIKIGYDARRGGFHSWHTDQDGSQSRAQWRRDGNRWAIDATGLTSDGKDLSAEFMLTRLDNNDFIWQAINRTLGGQSMPDSVPVKLTRVAENK